MEIIIFCVVMFVGVVYGYFTVSGSGIAERPLRKDLWRRPRRLRPGQRSGRDARVSMSGWSRGRARAPAGHPAHQPCSGVSE